MHLPHLLALPPAIIALCATSVAADPQWPHNVPRHLKYFPEDEVHAKRALSIKQKLQHERPIGVKKMSTDEGEMFMLDNWIFASDTQQSWTRSDADGYTNVTSQVLSPLRPLAQDDWLGRMHVRDVLLNRQFKCPDGTNSCSSIGAPDVCCGSDSNCITVTGSSNAGDVGCCPKGQACAGSVSCEVSQGYTSCPDAPNGGCCLPGFKCQGIGCKFSSCIYPKPMCMVINASFRRLRGHIHCLRPTLHLGRSHNDIRLCPHLDIALYRHHTRACIDLKLRIHMLNRLVLVPSVSRRWLLRERAHLCHRRIVSWRQRPNQHPRTRRPCPTY